MMEENWSVSNHNKVQALYIIYGMYSMYTIILGLLGQGK